MLSFLLVVGLLSVGGLAQGGPIVVTNNGELKRCNGQEYRDQAYTCFDGLLCPIVESLPFKRCGDGCYSPIFFNCVDDKLSAYQPATKPFKLFAYSPTKLVVGSVEACGQEFRIKEGGACAYCPSAVGNNCPPGKETVLLPGSGMNTMVPGGQRYYYSEWDGHLGFTQAHSSVAVNASFGGIDALDGGAFYFGNSDGSFVTCPSLDYKIYAKFTQSNAPNLPHDCFDFYLLTVPWKGTGAAAWEYV